MTKVERLLLAAASACVAAVLGYAAVRATEAALFPQPNPAAVIWSERSGFVWRAVLSLYIGGMGAFGGHALASRSPSACALWLSRGVVAAALAIAAQGTLLP